jgi:orotate phosphoribosyltransferase
VDALEMLLPAGTEALAGLELGGVPLATALSLKTGLPVAFIRKEAKTYGTCRYAEGAALAGKTFVILEDTVSSGGAILDALEKLRADGLEPAAVLSVIDRETGGREALEEADLTFLSLFQHSQLEAAS